MFDPAQQRTQYENLFKEYFILHSYAKKGGSFLGCFGGERSIEMLSAPGSEESFFRRVCEEEKLAVAVQTTNAALNQLSEAQLLKDELPENPAEIVREIQKYRSIL